MRQVRTLTKSPERASQPELRLNPATQSGRIQPFKDSRWLTGFTQVPQTSNLLLDAFALPDRDGETLNRRGADSDEQEEYPP